MNVIFFLFLFSDASVERLNERKQTTLWRRWLTRWRINKKKKHILIYTHGASLSYDFSLVRESLGRKKRAKLVDRSKSQRMIERYEYHNFSGIAMRQFKEKKLRIGICQSNKRRVLAYSIDSSRWTTNHLLSLCIIFHRKTQRRRRKSVNGCIIHSLHHTRAWTVIILFTLLNSRVQTHNYSEEEEKKKRDIWNKKVHWNI